MALTPTNRPGTYGSKLACEMIRDKTSAKEDLALSNETLIIRILDDDRICA